MNVLRNFEARTDPTLQNLASQMENKCDDYRVSFHKLNLLMFIPSILDPFYKLLKVNIALQMIFAKRILIAWLQKLRMLLISCLISMWIVTLLWKSRYQISFKHTDLVWKWKCKLVTRSYWEKWLRETR